MGLSKGAKWGVLDHGHVVYMDHMGCDAAVVEAARTSYQTGTKAVSDDRTLVRYLLRHRHSSPFESCVIKIHVKLPIHVERQWARHRTAGWNEVSARYSELPDECYVPDNDHVCYQATNNKQGSAEPIPHDQFIEFEFNQRKIQQAAHEQYRIDLANGVSREIARNSLPLSTYTEKVWYINLHNLLHLLGLRMDSHAQREIREFATVIGEKIVAELFPITWQAFLDYRLNAMTLTALDIAVIQKVMSSHFDEGSPSFAQWMSAMPEEWHVTKCRERDEFFAKITNLKLYSEVAES